MKKFLIPTLASLLIGCSHNNDFHFEKYAKGKPPTPLKHISTNPTTAPSTQPTKVIREPYPIPLYKVREMNSRTDHALLLEEGSESIYEIHDVFALSRDAADKIDTLGNHLEDNYSIEIGTIESVDRAGAKYMIYDHNNTELCVYGRPSKSRHRNIAGLDFVIEW